MGKRGNPNWQKGVSANPGGRPKSNVDVQALAQAYTVEAIEALHLALKDPRSRVAAAIALMDRGHGRPHQSHTLTHNIPAAATADAALTAIALAGSGFAPLSEGTTEELDGMVH